VLVKFRVHAAVTTNGGLYNLLACSLVRSRDASMAGKGSALEETANPRSDWNAAQKTCRDSGKVTETAALLWAVWVAMP
jgi:hypothetical protein